MLDNVPAEASVDQLCATLREHPLVEALWQEFVAFFREIAETFPFGSLDHSFGAPL